MVIMVLKSAEDTFTQQIFGHNIFDNEYLTFEPNINVATPDNYRLGRAMKLLLMFGELPRLRFAKKSRLRVLCKLQS